MIVSRRCRIMAVILPIRRKTLLNKSIRSRLGNGVAL